MSVHRFSWKTDPNPDKKPTVCVVRFGAFGDTVQAVSVCAAFKKLGYRVTLMCSYPASELVAFDPNIDELITLMQNQVPINWLGYYWHWMRSSYRGKGFDKWVNLTESVEHSLLATVGNVKFEWSAPARHKLMNFNYLEMQHDIAGVPYEPDKGPLFKFYPTEEEKTWRAFEHARMVKAGIKKFMIWPLAGSSRAHKIYPHVDVLWRHVFKYCSDWGIVTVGDGSCAELEAGFDGERKLWRTSGKWTMRQVCAMLELSDLVIGPETGVQSVAAFYPMPKIVFLSHSTVENLTRDWVNTTSMGSPATVCPGRGNNEAPACHKMLPDFNGCRRNEEFGVAQCTVELKPEWVWAVMQKAMNEGSGGIWAPPVID